MAPGQSAYIRSTDVNPVHVTVKFAEQITAWIVGTAFVTSVDVSVCSIRSGGITGASADERTNSTISGSIQ